MLDITKLIVYVNGRFVPGPEAGISVFDRGLLYGDAVFEGIREYSGRVFKLDEHIDRLYDSAQIIALHIPLSKNEIKEIILEVLRRNQLQDAHIRPIITRGCGQMGVHPGPGLVPTIIVFAHPWAPFLGSEGITMKTTAIRRIPPQCLDAKVKHVGYLNSILAGLEADIAGAQEALMLDINGLVTEGPGENFLIVKHGAVISPHTINILNGITLRTVMTLAREAGISAVEKNLTLGDVYTADEAFVCGTGAEIVPVREVDGRRIGASVPGPITCQLTTAFKELVRREGTAAY
ncbi:MAG: branched-chain-amino-acid transaminase [Deltaproteobacteria bacterium]|nr:branched-chain-amino-acid transaminase [Deltaproteobacteria bacterium]